MGTRGRQQQQQHRQRKQLATGVVNLLAMLADHDGDDDDDTQVGQVVVVRPADDATTAACADCHTQPPPPPAPPGCMSPRQMQKFVAATLIMCKQQREQPVLSASCLLYELNSATEQQPAWRACAKQPLCLHVFRDVQRHTHRLICVHAGRAVINQSIGLRLSVTRLSSKFLQLVDTHTNSAFGCGFSDELQLNAFYDGLLRIKSGSSSTAGAAAAAEVNGHSDAPAMSSHWSPAARSGTGSATAATGGCADEANALRLENERLKEALAQSSHNAKQWETQMAALRRANQNLAAALRLRSPDLQLSRQPVPASTHVAQQRAAVEKLKQELAQRLSLNDDDAALLQRFQWLGAEHVSQCELVAQLRHSHGQLAGRIEQLLLVHDHIKHQLNAANRAQPAATEDDGSSGGQGTEAPDCCQLPAIDDEDDDRTPTVEHNDAC